MTDNYVGEAYRNSLKNRYFGLLCEREQDGEWEKFLDAILIELEGMSEDSRSINWYHLYHKTSVLRYLRFEYFRKTLFDCMSLLSKVEVQR